MSEKQQKKAVYWKCGGGSLPHKWGYGFWTGADGDLLCIKSGIISNEEAEKYLSSICNTKKQAKRQYHINRKSQMIANQAGKGGIG